MTETRSRGEDPPAAFMTMQSLPLMSDDEAEEPIKGKIVSVGSRDAPAMDDPEVTPEVSEEEAVVKEKKEDNITAKLVKELPSTRQCNSTAPSTNEEEKKGENVEEKEVEHASPSSNSKDLLKPTKEGSMIQSGEDLHATSQSTTHTPDYINKQLKHGPRDATSTAPTNSAAPAYAFVSLKKTANPEEKKKKVESSPTLLPTVRLHKAAPVVKETKHFELPEEFCQAKQNLKRRTERPWYSHLPEAKPTKKWFFQKGEWSDGEPKKASPKEEPSKSWFFGSSDASKSASPTSTTSSTSPASLTYRGSHTKIVTGKETVHVQHFNELGENSHKKGLKTNYNKQYHEDLRRRRKGLPPKRRSSLLWRIFVWCFVLPLVLGSAFHCGKLYFPEHAAWEQIQPQVDPILHYVRHHIGPIVEQVEPHFVSAVEKLEPHVAAFMEQVKPLVQQIRPRVISAVDQICSQVEAYEVPDNMKWAEPMRKASVTICAAMRKKMDTVTEGEIPANTNTTAGDHDNLYTGFESLVAKRKGKAQSKKSPSLSTNDSASGDCECDSKGPKWVKRLLPGRNRDNRQECCKKQNPAL